MGKTYLKLIFFYFFAAIGDVAGIFGGDNLCRKDVSLMGCATSVDFITVDISAYPQRTRGNAALTQASGDPTVCTWNYIIGD